MSPRQEARGRIRITIRYVDGCPNWRTADARLREALDSKGLEAEIVHELIGTAESAERLMFSGSPTVLIAGVDPFPRLEAAFGLTCRLYETDEGLQGSPSVDQLLEVLDRPGV